MYDRIVNPINNEILNINSNMAKKIDEYDLLKTKFIMCLYSEINLKESTLKIVLIHVVLVEMV